MIKSYIPDQANQRINQAIDQYQAQVAGAFAPIRGGEVGGAGGGALPAGGGDGGDGRRGCGGGGGGGARLMRRF